MTNEPAWQPDVHAPKNTYGCLPDEFYEARESHRRIRQAAYAMVDGVRLAGSHHRGDIALAAVRSEVTV